MHVHFHVLCLDGVHVETEAKDGTLRFEAAPAPSREELQETLRYIYARVMKWLARRGLFREADASNEAPSYSAGEAMTLAGMQRGSPPAMISHASDCAATSRVRPSRFSLARLGVRRDGPVVYRVRTPVASRSA